MTVLAGVVVVVVVDVILAYTRNGEIGLAILLTVGTRIRLLHIEVRNNRSVGLERWGMRRSWLVHLLVVYVDKVARTLRHRFDNEVPLHIRLTVNS